VGDGDVAVGVSGEGVPLALSLLALAHAGPSIAIDNPTNGKVRLPIHPPVPSASQCCTQNPGETEAVGRRFPQPGVPQIVRDTN
jgi:hypothetical protein